MGCVCAGYYEQELLVSFSHPSDAKERVRAAVDIVDLIGAVLPLRRQGRIFVALCPWHEDSRPSLQVNPDRQSWKCWVCGDGGDIFSFWMKHEGVEFREALEMLADRAGIELGPRGPQEGRLSPENDKKLLYQIMAWAEEQYHRELLDSPAAELARKYLADRQISSDSLRRYRLGFAPPQWQWIVEQARKAKHPEVTLYTLGLAARSDKTGQAYDRFRGRLLFPIHDSQGRSIALGGRVIPGLSEPDSAKYINSPETRLFTKNEHLYGLDIVRDGIQKKREIIVMEGYTDVIIARQAGIDNVTAVLGTALGVNHIRLLRRFADRVVLVLDGDEAGQRRTQDILELFIAGQVDARVVTLPDNLDPADFILAHGAAAFEQLVAAAVDALEFKLRCVTRGFDPARDTHRAHAALEDVLSTLAKAPRVAPTAASDSVRLREQQTLVRLARHFMVDEIELRKRLVSLRQPRSTPGSAWGAPDTGSPLPNVRADERPWSGSGTPHFPAGVRPSGASAEGRLPGGMPSSAVAAVPAPAGSRPGQAVSGQNMPAPAVSGPTVPDQTFPGQAFPGQTFPGQALVLHEWERELFELMLERPALVSIVLEQVDPAELETDTARHLLAIYQELEGSGSSLEFTDLLTAIEIPSFKSLLVAMDDRISARGSSDCETRFQELLAAFQRRRQEQACRQSIFTLDKEQLSETEQLDLLKGIIEAQRIRQGISAPTDG